MPVAPGQPDAVALAAGLPGELAAAVPGAPAAGTPDGANVFDISKSGGAKGDGQADMTAVSICMSHI